MFPGWLLVWSLGCFFFVVIVVAVVVVVVVVVVDFYSTDPVLSQTQLAGPLPLMPRLMITGEIDNPDQRICQAGVHLSPFSGLASASLKKKTKKKHILIEKL